MKLDLQEHMQGNSYSSSLSMQTKVFILKHCYDFFFLHLESHSTTAKMTRPAPWAALLSKHNHQNYSVYTKLSYTESYQQNFNLANMLCGVKENLYLLRKSPLLVVNDSVKSLK